MALFKRGPGKDAVEAAALVVDAEAPLQNHGAQWGNTNECAIHLLIDAGAGPQLVSRRFHLADDQWLVAGMDVPVLVEPGKAKRFEVEWERVPAIEERVLAADPALTDPVAARARVTQALNAAGVLPGYADVGLAFAGEGYFGRFSGSVAQAAAEPAPAGRRHAVATVASVRMLLRSDGATDAHTARTCAGASDTVLAVAAEGAAPYALLARGLEKPGGLGDLTGVSLPATVAEVDPRDVQIRWDVVRVAPQVGMQGADIAAALEQQMAIYRQWQQRNG